MSSFGRLMLRRRVGHSMLSLPSATYSRRLYSSLMSSSQPVVLDSLRLFSSDARNNKDTAAPTTLVAKQSSPSILKAYAELSKARLSALVVATTAAGFVAAGGPLFCPATLAACCTGTALCSSSAAAFNQIFESQLDAKMKRTQQRPLVQGTLTQTQATVAATAWGFAGTGILAYTTDPVTTFLGASNIVLYAGVYTYMKQHSVYNTWVGAVVGAIPPVMGWSAATGGHVWDPEALLLGATLYLWQMPHFFALSYMHRLDYARGGFQMVPVLEENGDRTSQLITRYTWYLSTIPVLATVLDVTNSMFLYEGVALNTYALYVAYKFQYERTNANARKVFLTSLWYLPCLLMLLLLHSKTWDDVDEGEQVENPLRGYISSSIHAARDTGRQLCLHETAVNKTEDGEKACPVTLGKKTSNEIAEQAKTTIVLEQESSQA